MHVTPRPLSYYTDLLNDDTPFSFSRFGDGEWACILGQDGTTCDGQPYTADLGLDLENAVSMGYEGKGFVALGPAAIRHLGPQIRAWLEKRNMAIDWHSTEVFLQASIDGTLHPFIQALRSRSLLYVGPAHLRAFARDVLGAEAFVEVPAKDAFSQVSRILDDIRRMMDDVKINTICYSAGPTANVLIFDVSATTHGLTQIDMGSIFDVYTGVKSRSYMRKGPYNWQKLYKINFEGEA